jgi:ferredoxin-NADP reductase
LIAGGAGVVPLMAMARARAQAMSTVPMRLLFSSRTVNDIVYRDELDRLSAGADGLMVFHTLTRGAPNGWSGYDRRVDEAMLADVAWLPADEAQVFVCGPTDFVETVARGLVAQGHAAKTIKTERFGATGGSR